MPHEDENLADAISAVYVPIGGDDKRATSGCLEFVNIIALGDRLVGPRIHYLRCQRSWSRMHLARRAGIELEAVKLAETNPGETPIGIFLKICGALRISVHELTEELVTRFQGE